MLKGVRTAALRPAGRGSGPHASDWLDGSGPRLGQRQQKL